MLPCVYLCEARKATAANVVTACQDCYFDRCNEDADGCNEDADGCNEDGTRAGPLDAAADFLSLPESLTAGLARMLPNADRAAKQTEAKPTETKSFLDIPRPKLLRAQDAIPQPRSSSFVSRALDRLRLPSLPDADLPLSNPVRDFLSSSGPN